MACDWKTCSPDIKEFVLNLYREIAEVINDDIVGFYIHGSLAMGGFNPDSSDIDILVVKEKEMAVETKRELAKLFLAYSDSPFPVEISFLNTGQLKNWQHPCPYDFHYSEFWRDRYETDIVMGRYRYINEDSDTDTDLAAHITITNHRGICVKGKPVSEVFPLVPRSDYILSIAGDYEECLEKMAETPVYCVLNVTRVYWYLKEGVISSK